MEHFVNKIDRESLERGDHIYAYRKLGSYSHHGIFIGGDRVIHYNITQKAGTSRRAKTCRNCGVDPNQLRGVVKSCVDCFLKGHTLRRFQYGVTFCRFLTNNPGTCTTGQAHPPDVIISRANDLLNNKDGFGEYHLFDNNCEAFAVFCTTANRVSNQACSAVQLLKASVKVAVDRLLCDVSVHHGPEKHDKLKQTIDTWLANMFSLNKIITNLQKDQEFRIQGHHDHQLVN
ncbi:hypothetical protein M0R45_038412 [Rubus argutus]|uniref:LRAT domain-containing protein n=1 Tax=Rubus argutus TaxID=59490 RepID=A0AAW1W5M4_RUBAR